ncbi:hypothetical protein HPG69_002243 [Diceros bicornis minor]|uniref:Peptidase S1 domain-containing protein n=1 Tax=Diceros bicornis minor TaxID=77932 RepID=A0A7J7FCI8_DICBM|nr:hypothetical protein HPG69_002243 [Diceros bicornis minor]
MCAVAGWGLVGLDGRTDTLQDVWLRVQRDQEVTLETPCCVTMRPRAPSPMKIGSGPLQQSSPGCPVSCPG